MQSVTMSGLARLVGAQTERNPADASTRIDSCGFPWSTRPTSLTKAAEIESPNSLEQAGFELPGTIPDLDVVARPFQAGFVPVARRTDPVVLPGFRVVIGLRAKPRAI